MPLIDKIGARVTKILEQLKFLEARTTELEVKALSALGVCVHRDIADHERPHNYEVVVWIGSVEPDNAHDDDIWLPDGP